MVTSSYNLQQMFPLQQYGAKKSFTQGKEYTTWNSIYTFLFINKKIKSVHLHPPKYEWQLEESSENKICAFTSPKIWMAIRRVFRERIHDCSCRW